MQRKKILFVLHTPPPVHGAAMVGKTIQDSRAINEAFQCQFINLSTSSTVESVGKFSLSKITSVFKLRRRIQKAISDFRPDLLYYTPSASGFAFWKDLFITNAIKHSGTPLVYHFHNKGVSKKQDSFPYNWAYRRFFQGVKVILLAEPLYRDMEKFVRPEQLFFCGNGIAENKTQQGRGTGHDIPVVLFLSNLIKEKGLMDLLDACEIVKQQDVQFICHIVGGATEEMDGEKLHEEIERRGLSGQVRYLGKKYGEEKDAVYADTDLFVFPTFYPKECFPVVLLEAMQHGLPCITTEEGACSSIVDDGITGLIVQRRNPEDLAGKLTILINNPSIREDMGRKGRQKYLDNYTLAHFEDNFKKILEDCFVGGTTL